MGAQDNAVVTTLMAASLNGHEQVALVLLKAGALLGAQNNAGMTALMIASQNGHEQVVRVLLEAGADRNPNSNCGVMCCASVDVKNAIFIA